MSSERSTPRESITVRVLSGKKTYVVMLITTGILAIWLLVIAFDCSNKFQPPRSNIAALEKTMLLFVWWRCVYEIHCYKGIGQKPMLIIFYFHFVYFRGSTVQWLSVVSQQDGSRDSKLTIGVWMSVCLCVLVTCPGCNLPLALSCQLGLARPSKDKWFR